MKWEIIIEIESGQLSGTQISIVKVVAEEAVLEVLKHEVKFINSIAKRQ